MTGDERRSGPPWSVDLLADLHAGVLDQAEEAELRALVAGDAEALAVLGALDATQAELANLPTMRMPEDVAARIDAALAAEVAASRPAPIAPVVDIEAARRRRNRRLGWGSGLVAAAAVAVGVTMLVSTTGTPTSGFPQAVPTPGNATSSEPRTEPPNGPLLLQNEDYGAALPKVLGAKDAGALDSPQKITACLQANGVNPQVSPLGVRRVEVKGKQGVMFLLPTGKVMRTQVLVVEPTCAAGNPATIANSVIGG
ncbi:hypothetical protein GCM10010174_32930 [Kutzneria viridogrisea]|uniref:Uncharacterized protein n=2 Tax=Kutzneria TaxID=43356 RepID=W5WMW5_9PSEU|nr:hypothetical protein [Kutzneria albida]AHI02183.1 hypothetical protein KALB_8826 [Kutzneria albida DSM 43870]MBA8929254.1 hypothetical protein [Kutzneria viridogrisea]